VAYAYERVSEGAHLDEVSNLDQYLDELCRLQCDEYERKCSRVQDERTMHCKLVVRITADGLF